MLSETQQSPDEKTLFLQFFACHGLIEQNQMQVVSNEVNLETGFYKTIKVENKVKLAAPVNKNCYFFTAFSSVRETFWG